MNWLRQHFLRHQQRPPRQFLLRVTTELFLLAVAGMILGSIFEIPSRNIRERDIPMFMIGAVAVAPALETLLFQFLPILAAKACGAGRKGQIITSVVPFAVLHFVASPLTGLTAGLMGGLYFAFTFTHWQQRSLGVAFGMTFALHTLYNACVVLLVAVAQTLS